MPHSNQLMINLDALLNNLHLASGEDVHASITIDQPDNFIAIMIYSFDLLAEFISSNTIANSKLFSTRFTF